MAALIELKGSSTGSTSGVFMDHRLAATAAELAHTNDVMLEQLAFLLEHPEEHGLCGCSTCRRYLRVREVLMEIFADPSVKLARTA